MNFGKKLEKHGMIAQDTLINRFKYSLVIGLFITGGYFLGNIIPFRAPKHLYHPDIKIFTERYTKKQKDILISYQYLIYNNKQIKHGFYFETITNIINKKLSQNKILFIETGNYSNGKKEGNWLTYHESLGIVMIAHYINDELTYSYECNSSWEIITSCSYKKGRPWNGTKVGYILHLDRVTDITIDQYDNGKLVKSSYI